MRSPRSFALFALLAACSSSQMPIDAGRDIVTIDTRNDVAIDVAPDLTQPFDAGPAPTCSMTATARHIVDRPGDDRPADPSSVLALPSNAGFLVAFRRVDLAIPDGGVADGGRVPVARDSIDVLALADDGTPRGASTPLYDGAPMSTTTDNPVLMPSGSGAFVVFQESHGMVGDPGFFVRLRGGVIDAMGAGASPGVFRANYTRPVFTALANGNLLGLSSRVESAGDAGAVVTPVTMYVTATGTMIRAADTVLTNVVPPDAQPFVLTRSDNGGAILAMRTGGQLGLLRFSPDGVSDAHGVYSVQGTPLPVLDDAASVGDGVVVAWSRSNGGRTEVHVLVASDHGALRLDRMLESFMNEGDTVASVAPAYGGVAVFWRRGTGAAARVRFAIVSPDGTVRSEPADLVAAPNVSGRIVATVNGRRASFVARDGDAPGWGYTFGQACLPGG